MQSLQQICPLFEHDYSALLRSDELLPVLSLCTVLQVCDDEGNTCQCGWDGGDCCLPSSDYSYCSQCECLHSTSQSPTTEATTPGTTSPRICVDGKSLLGPVSCSDGWHIVPSVSMTSCFSLSDIWVSTRLQCKDNIVQWADVWGYRCDDYALNGWCSGYAEQNTDSKGRSAAEACCACGGGNVDNEWTYTTLPPCEGSMPNWVSGVFIK